MDSAVWQFFGWSDALDHDVLRPLSHIHMNWELTWDGSKYEPEEDSYAAHMNALIDLIATTTPPVSYHEHEDIVATYLAKRDPSIYKERGRWLGTEYVAILERGGFEDIDQEDLIKAATGRVHAAIKRGQATYDDMEDGHRIMLAGVLTVILYHRH